MYAIIETSGKQYRVQEGDTIYIDAVSVAVNDVFEFNKVLFIEKEGQSIVGTPVVEGAKVVGKIEEHGKGKKITVFKYKPKKNYKRKQGHRQLFTKVKIESIQG